MERLRVDITYHMNDAEYGIKGNIEPNRYSSFISEYLQTKIGGEVDKSVAEDLSSYDITIFLDLKDDLYTIESNTGNRELTDGILLDIINREGN